MTELDFDAAYRGESEWFAASADPPWEIGEPQRAVVDLAHASGFHGAVLDAGCGTGEHVLYLAARGYDVVGVDAAPTAIARAQEKAHSRGVTATFAVVDAVELPGYARQFDTVLDTGLFHTFDDDQRARYVRALHRVCREGARVHVLCFSDDAPPEYGPRTVSAAELRAAFRDGWHVDEVRATSFEGLVPHEFAGESVGVAAGERTAMPAWLATATKTGPGESDDRLT